MSTCHYCIEQKFEAVQLQIDGKIEANWRHSMQTYSTQANTHTAIEYSIWSDFAYQALWHSLEMIPRVFYPWHQIPPTKSHYPPNRCWTWEICNLHDTDMRFWPGRVAAHSNKPFHRVQCQRQSNQSLSLSAGLDLRLRRNDINQYK